MNETFKKRCFTEHPYYLFSAAELELMCLKGGSFYEFAGGVIRRVKLLHLFRQNDGHCWSTLQGAPNMVVINGTCGCRERFLLTYAENGELLDRLHDEQRRLGVVPDFSRRRSAQGGAAGGDVLKVVTIDKDAKAAGNAGDADFGKVNGIRDGEGELNLACAAGSRKDEVGEAEGDGEVAAQLNVDVVTHSTADSTTAAQG